MNRSSAGTKLHKRARRAVARSVAAERWLAVLSGLLLLVCGGLVLLLSYGVLGTARAGRPLLDPMIVEALRAYRLWFRVAAIVGGAALVAFGLSWAARSVRPERRPDLVLSEPSTYSTGSQARSDRILVTSAAAAEAVATHTSTLPGVHRARARLVGTERAPALRLVVWLAEDADIRAVLAAIDDEVLATARESLELTGLPAAVRFELDAPGPRPRVT